MKSLLTWALVSVLVLPVVALAHDAKNPRHIAMTGLGDAMRVISEGLKAGQITETMKAQAANVAEISKTVPGLFAKPDHHKKSRAKPEIWTDFAGFEKANQKLVLSAASLNAALKADNVDAARSALKLTGDSCRGCHKAYRLPKK